MGFGDVPEAVADIVALTCRDAAGVEIFPGSYGEKQARFHTF